MKTRTLLIIGAGLTLGALVLGTLVFGGSTYGGIMGPGMMGGYGMMGGFSWVGMLVMMLFWVGVVILAIWGLRYLLTARLSHVEPDAEEILKQRFARGDISSAEFAQAREVLHSAPHV